VALVQREGVFEMIITHNGEKHLVLHCQDCKLSEPPVQICDCGKLDCPQCDGKGWYCESCPTDYENQGIKQKIDMERGL